MFSFFRKKKYFTDAELTLIKSTIEQAESGTSGEIRVLVEKSTDGYDVLDRAAQHFEKLKMHKTALRNGVLIYLAMEEKQFAVAGDSGIHHYVKNEFWETVKLEMFDYLADGKTIDGICHAVQMVGTELQKYFPHQSSDRNELPNDVVMR